MSRRRAASRRKKSSGLRFKLVVFIVLLGIIGWVGMTAYTVYFHIKPLQQSPSHTFIAQETSTPVIAVVKQSSQTSQIDTLIVLKADLENRSVSALQLPVNLSDGQTTIGQYVESRYYKEMQLALEQQLALPLTDYIIQPRDGQNQEADSVIDNFSLQKPTDWWSTTVGLPMWMNDIADFHSSLDPWELLQILWLIRDLNLDPGQVSQTPDSAQAVEDSKLQLIPEEIDPVVEQTFVSSEIQGEGGSVVVKNATEVTGLASLTSRFVANMGGEVVAVEPADTSQTNSSITTDHQTELSGSLAQFLGIPETIEAKTGRERADIELIIGTDALVRLGK